MRLLIYGDIGGSGGYIRYCKGLLGSKSIPEDIEVWFVCGVSLYHDLSPLDPEVHIITHRWMTSRNRYCRYLWYLWVYPRIVRRIKPHAEFYPSGHLRVYLRRALTISTCHNLLLFDEKELGLITNRKERKYFYRSSNYQTRTFQKSDAVIFLSNHSKQVVSNKIPSIKRSTVIGHGLDKAFLTTEKRSYQFGNRIRILYVSPIYSYKHQVEVVKSIKLLRNFSWLDIDLYLIGDDNSTAAFELKQAVKTENAEQYVVIKGGLNYKDLINEYKSADIFIFASSSETFGITLLEAMGSRLPIACSDRTGLPEILKDGGVYFNPEEPNSIAEAVLRLIKDTNLREALGERSCTYAAEYTWERCTFLTFNYIRSLVC